MKKFVISAFFIVILIVGIFIYFDFNERKSSYDTLKEALMSIDEPEYKVIEIIDSKLNSEKDYAYVFYYSQIEESKDFFAISEFEKNKYGWQFNKRKSGMLVSYSEETVNGGTRYGGEKSGGLYYGIATSDVTTVTLGLQVAELIPLEDKDLKVWIFFNPSSEDLEHDLEFKNKDGKIFN